MAIRVLLLGGHGKIAMFMTPKLLSRSWQVSSVVRNPAHEEEIREQAKGQPGRLDVLVRSLDDVKSEQDAQSIIDTSRPDYVIWSAGAGGKGGPSRTYAIDRDAAQHFIRASIRTPSVKKFLMVSYIASRKSRPHWWSDEDWESAQKFNNEILPDYAKAKIAADEMLTALSTQREDFQGICLRPGTLNDDAPTGRVTIGHTSSRGNVTRSDVAEVAVQLLEIAGARGRFDLLNGDKDIAAALKHVVDEGIDCTEGEDMDTILGSYKL